MIIRVILYSVSMKYLVYNFLASFFFSFLLLVMLFFPLHRDRDYYYYYDHADISTSVNLKRRDSRLFAFWRFAWLWGGGLLDLISILLPVFPPPFHFHPSYHIGFWVICQSTMNERPGQSRYCTSF